MFIFPVKLLLISIIQNLIGKKPIKMYRTNFRILSAKFSYVLVGPLCLYFTGSSFIDFLQNLLNR